MGSTTSLPSISGCSVGCDDGDPCTTDDCREGRCAQSAVLGTAAATCVCHRGRPKECGEEALPQAILRSTTKACDALARVDGATIGKTRKLLKKASRRWKSASRRLDQRAITSGVSDGCVRALRGALQEAATRAVVVRAGLTANF